MKNLIKNIIQIIIVGMVIIAAVPIIVVLGSIEWVFDDENTKHGQKN